MRFEALLSRADDVILQKFLGGPAVRLLMSLDSQLATPTKLRELVVRLKKPEGLLLTPETREELFSLLRPDEALELAGLLGLQRSGDPYKQLELLNLQRGSKRERLLFGFFELEVPTLEEQVILPTVEKCDAGYGLFDYQRHVVRQVAQVLSEPPHRALLHMPTGSGKTRTAMNIIADCLRANEPTLVVWLAYSEELCEQAAEEFLRCWKHLGNRTISLYRFWGNHNLDMQDVRDGVVVAGLSKLYSSLCVFR